MTMQGTGENCIAEGCKAVATLGWHCVEHHAAFVEKSRAAFVEKSRAAFVEKSRKEALTRDQIETTLSHLLSIARLAQLVPSDEQLRRYIDVASRADAQALLDPTLWMKASKKNDCFLKIAQALVIFRASLPSREEAEEADRAAASYRERESPR